MLKQANTWLKLDDVLEDDFLAGIIIIAEEGQTDQVHAEMSAAQFPLNWNTTWWSVITSKSCGDLLQPGPYVIANGKVSKAYRINDDTNEAFVAAARPQVVSEASGYVLFGSRSFLLLLLG